MTSEEKQLVLNDLCARLPHGVKVHINSSIEEQNQMKLYDVNLESETIGVKNEQWAFRAIPIVDREDNTKMVKPYLRPMSSMTDKENEELKYEIELELQALEGEEGHNIVSAAPAAFEVDFYNKHHFDYHGLIEKGLAIEAPEGMYKTE